MGESQDTYKIKLNTCLNAIHKLQGKPAKPSLDLQEIPSLTNAEEIKRVKTQMQRLEEAFSRLQKKVMKAQQEVDQANQTVSKMQPGLEQLNDLATLQQQLNELIQKQNEGSKFNKQDYRTVSEIYEQLECKMDKAEFSNKVDKDDLKKVQRLLGKKIEEIKSLLANQSRQGTAPAKPDSSAFVRSPNNYLSNNYECVACGNEFQQLPRETLDLQIHSRLPKSRNGSFGPGFSRVLGSMRYYDAKTSEFDLPEILKSSIHQSKNPL